MTALELLESGGWTWVKGDFGAIDLHQGCLATLILVAYGESPERVARYVEVLTTASVLFPDRDCHCAAAFNDHEKTTEADVRRVLKVAGA